MLNLLLYSLSLREAKAGTEDRSLKPKPWRKTVYCLLPGAHLNASLMLSKPTCLGMVLLAVGWALLCELSLRKMLHKYAHSPVIEAIL